MASLLTKNAYMTGRVLNRSFSGAPRIAQFSRGISSNKPMTILPKSYPVTFSRGFAQDSQKDSQNQPHLKDGLPEQYKWTGEHLEKYLRDFSAKHNIKEDDVNHLVKTFVTGANSAKDFFSLDREALAAKVGKDTADRTKLGNLLVAEVWKETQEVGKKIQNYGTLLVGAAAIIFGAYAYNQYADDSSSKKSSSSSSSKSSSSSSSSSTPKDTEDAKKKTAQAFKDDGAIGKQFTEKGAIGGTAQKIGGPFDKDGAIGKQFTKDGAIGGAVQDKAEQKESEHSKGKSSSSSSKDHKDNSKDNSKDVRDSKEGTRSQHGGKKDSTGAAASSGAHGAENASNQADNAPATSGIKNKDSKDHKSSSKDTEDTKKKAAQAFKDDGAVGKQFTEKGAIGGTAQKIGGPFDKDGAIGKQFTKDGAIGGAVQKKAEEKEEEHKSKSRN